jgi:hypothetical protein
MGNLLRGVDRGAGNENGHFTGRPMPGAVSPGLKVGSDVPDKSGGLCGAPMTRTPHRLAQPLEGQRSRLARGTQFDIKG